MFQYRSNSFGPSVSAIQKHLGAVERELETIGRVAGRRGSATASAAGAQIGEAVSATLSDLIERLRDAVPIPLVLHGSSGVPDDALAAGVRAGIVKVNIGTALNLAYTGAVRAFLAADERTVDPRKFLKPARTALAETVAQMLSVVSC